MLRFTARDLIRDLQALLRDRYRDNDGGIAIVKEVIQNADDAGATALFLAHFEEAAPEAGVNPLCFRAGILVVNDAPFEKRHERAFTSFSTSSKDQEEGQIGRFGIGRKSLFHWTEVIFYLGCAADGKVRGGVINPWAEQQDEGEGSNRSVYVDQRNPSWLEWKTDGREGAILRERAMRLLGARGKKPWFAVWLPSRPEADEGRSLTRVSTDREILPFSRARLDPVARLMPQLSKLVRIEFHIVPLDPNTKTTAIARIERDGAGLGRPGADILSGDRDTTGTVSIGLIGPTGRQNDSWKLDYHIAERLVDGNELTEIKTHPNWPTEPPEDFQNPDAMATPAKAAPHGGASVIIGTASDPLGGRLQLHNAIFLPLSGASATERVSMSVPVDVSVFLHGYQFPDSGRQHVDGNPEVMAAEPDSAPGVRARWNQLVRQHATLPNLLPALARALNGCSTAQGRRILKAINQSALLRDSRGPITVSHQLVVGPGFAKATLVHASQRCLGLPEPRDKPVLAALAEVAEEMAGRFALAWCDDPGLLTTHRTDDWKSDDIKAFGDRIRRNFGSEPKAWLGWMATWAQGLGRVAPDEVGAMALAIYRACMADEDWSKLTKDSAWKELVPQTRSSHRDRHHPDPVRSSAHA